MHEGFAVRPFDASGQGWDGCACSRAPGGRVLRPSRLSLSAEDWEAGRAFLERTPSVDVHSHPGRFFMGGTAPQTMLAAASPPFAESAAAELNESGASAALFALVADHVLLEQSDLGLQAFREFQPGEAFSDFQRQIAMAQGLIDHSLLLPALTSKDVVQAHALGRSACMISVEGGDFIEDRLERVQAAYDAGVRSVTLVHYHSNQLGDPQTVPPLHGGLTGLGREVVAEMNRCGMIVDLSHASFAATEQAAAVSTGPMMISHSNLRAAGLDHPRLISLEHARLVTTSGGIVGVVPAGFGQATFEDYIETILRMVDALGADHVAIGTDMDYTYKPVLTSYADWAAVPALLLKRGMTAAVLAKVMGGNFLRVLDACQA